MTTKELIDTRIEGMEDLEDIINTVEFTVREAVVNEALAVGSYESKSGGGEFTVGYKQAMEDIIKGINL